MSDKVELNPCGHPVACVVTHGTTSHCGWCADQEQFHARIDKLRQDRSSLSRSDKWALFAAASLAGAESPATFGEIADDADKLLVLYDKRWGDEDAK